MDVTEIDLEEGSASLMELLREAKKATAENMRQSRLTLDATQTAVDSKQFRTLPPKKRQSPG